MLISWCDFMFEEEMIIRGKKENERRKQIPNQFQIMDLVLQLDLLVPQLAQLLWQMLYQEPGKEAF